MLFAGTSACTSVVEGYAGVGRAPGGPATRFCSFVCGLRTGVWGAGEEEEGGVGVLPVGGGTGLPQMLVRVEALHSGIHPVTQAGDMEALRGKGTRLEPQIQVLGGLSGAPFSPAPLTR